MSRGDFILVTFVYVFLAILLVIFTLPLLNVLSSSFSSPGAVMGGKVWAWPVDLSVESYTVMFSIRQIWLGYGNSFFYAGVGTLINLIFTVAAAYPLSKREMMGRGTVMGLFAFTMFFGGGLIPTFMLIRSLGMINTRWALIIPNAIGVGNMIIARTFFQTGIPGELYDAAEIDGASEITTLIRLVLPLSGPIIAVLGLWYAVGHWNDFFMALIYLTDFNLYPLQLVLREYLFNSNMLEQILSAGGMTTADDIARRMGQLEVLKYAIIVVASLPMIMLYPFIQRFFIKGVMVGSLKG